MASINFVIKILGIVLIIISVNLFVADYFYKKKNYEKAFKLNPFEPRYRMSLMLSQKPLDMDTLKKFYLKNKHNPFVEKTISNFKASGHKRY